MRYTILLLVLAFASAVDNQGTTADSAATATVKTSAGFSVAASTETGTSEGAAAELSEAEAAKQIAEAEAADDADAMTKKEIDDVMLAVDTNKDGKLSWDEVLVHAKAQRQAEIDEAKKAGAIEAAESGAWDEESEKSLKELFQTSDADKDGFLVPSELPALKEAESDDHEQLIQQKEAEEAGDEEEDDETEEHEAPRAASLLEQGELEEEDEGDERAAGSEDDEHEGRDPHEDMKAFLKSADKNQDGKLSLEEVKLAVGQDSEASASVAEGADTSLEEEFKAADKNGDGQLDEDELKGLHMDEEEHEGEGEEQEHDDEHEASFIEEEGYGDDNDTPAQQIVDQRQLKQTFQNLDSNKDGKLTWDDVAAGMGKAEKSKLMPAGVNMRMIKDDFRKADKDEDGLLDFKDFSNMVSTIIGQMGDKARDLVPQFLAATTAQI